MIDPKTVKHQFVDGSPDPEFGYQVLRRTEYPSLADQLDALWKGGEAMELMRQRILAIKEKYPNPKKS